jgi:L-ascorbate metabolism protein UlaG (beta-lactamase superfamily)
MALTVTRVNHSSVLLDFDGRVLLTDPWFSERPNYHHGERCAFTPAELPRLSAVVVSHDHYDHYDMDAFAAYPDHRVPVIVKRGTAAPARRNGFDAVTELDPWESIEVDGVRITAAPALHGVPENTYVIEGGGRTVFFGADTLRIPELDEVARRFPNIDLALLPINGLRIRLQLNRQVVMNAEEAAELCSVLHPRLAVPIHYSFTAGWLGDHLFLRYDGTPDRFRRAAGDSAPETRIRVLGTGEPLPVPRSEEESH